MCFVCVVQQITLQALPGLPPGAQGLLVKTESGQYQLLRVGMSPAPAAAGTTVVPSTVATTTSMSIAQQLPSTPSLSSTSTFSVNNHVVSSSLPLTVSSSQSVVTVPAQSNNSQLVGTVGSSTSSSSSTNTTVPTTQSVAGVTTVVVSNPAGISTASKAGTGTASPAPSNPTSQTTYRLQPIPSANNTAVSSSFYSASSHPFDSVRRVRLLREPP